MRILIFIIVCLFVSTTKANSDDSCLRGDLDAVNVKVENYLELISQPGSIAKTVRYDFHEYINDSDVINETYVSLVYADWSSITRTDLGGNGSFYPRLVISHPILRECEFALEDNSVPQYVKESILIIPEPTLSEAYVNSPLMGVTSEDLTLSVEDENLIITVHSHDYPLSERKLKAKYKIHLKNKVWVFTPIVPAEKFR
jgi:hypothetical protein